ncbi:hypothetical protein TNCV_4072031 [Trichonephila clavipes]|uniref:Uncharacterized protein n=1 Tax=Trichonephila clavipes TaxID=2585209 RepID=A0A8X6W843_TRICX|nr:hypothetical protein TNCV_4072031 [Trichonephila clavipes]
MNESSPPHPQPRPSTSRKFLAERTSKPLPTTQATLPQQTLPPKGPFRCPNSIPREGKIVAYRDYGLPFREIGSRAG